MCQARPRKKIKKNAFFFLPPRPEGRRPPIAPLNLGTNFIYLMKTQKTQAPCVFCVFMRYERHLSGIRVAKTIRAAYAHEWQPSQYGLDRAPDRGFASNSIVPCAGPPKTRPPATVAPLWRTLTAADISPKQLRGRFFLFPRFVRRSSWNDATVDRCRGPVFLVEDRQSSSHRSAGNNAGTPNRVLLLGATIVPAERLETPFDRI